MPHPQTRVCLSRKEADHRCYNGGATVRCLRRRRAALTPQPAAAASAPAPPEPPSRRRPPASIHGSFRFQHVQACAQRHTPPPRLTSECAMKSIVATTCTHSSRSSLSSGLDVCVQGCLDGQVRRHCVAAQAVAPTWPQVSANGPHEWARHMYACRLTPRGPWQHLSAQRCALIVCM